MILLKKILFSFVLLFFSFFSLFSQEKLRVSEINLSGNNITNDEIIYRELLFEIGDQILVDQLPDLIEKSTNNLLNTSLFNFVTITHSITRSSLKIEIVFQERWYIWPYPVLEHADRNLSSYLNNEEWSRIDYGLFVLINNFRGRKEILKLKTIFGFNNRYGLTYYKPFIDKKQKVGFGLDLNYYQNREVAFQINNNELDYIKSGNDYVRETLEFTGFITYRPQMYTNHLIAIKYDDVSVYDTVVKLNDNYFFNHENKINLFSLIYNFDFDKRDSKIYPLTGFRFFTAIAKKGIGIASDKGPFYVKSIAEENLKLSNRFYFNTSVGWKYSFNNINSFYFSKAIGYDNYIRGMEYYVSNGCHYYVSKSNFKFELIPQTNLNLNFLSSNKFSKAHYAFYINLFFDTGYVDSNYNIHTSLSNEFLYSGGVGLDFVTYYDKVLRIEYSLNKFGEHGLFFHLGAPIIE